MQSTLHNNTIIQNVNSAFSPDKFVNCCSTATRSQCLRRSILPRAVYKSSFWASKEVYEMSHH